MRVFSLSHGLIMAAAALAVSLAPASAHAGTITQTFNMPTTTTDISGGMGTFTFNYFQSAGAPSGAVLSSVQLLLSVTETVTSLTVSNSDGNNSHTFQYQSYSNIIPVGTAPAADKTALNMALAANGGALSDIDLLDTGMILFTAGETKTYAPPNIVQTGTSNLINSAAASAYDTTGTFTLGFTTSTAQSFIGAGGNGSNTQATSAIGTVSVVYNYDVPPPVPEPASMALLGTGLLGLGAMLRRRRRG